MRIVIDNKIPFIKGVLEPFADVTYINGSKICNSDLLNVDALIIRTRTKVNKDLLEGTKVRFVGTATIGTDHIDTNWCDTNGIKWTSAPGCNSGSVMQYVVTSILSLARKYNIVLKGKTIGVVGVGNVGSKVANACEALGMNVLRNDPPRERKEGKTGFLSLDDLIAGSDIISLHVPLTTTGIDKTYRLAGELFFEKMKKGSLLINTSRGPVINEKLLLQNLVSKHLRGTVLDVWVNEPAISKDLLGLVDIGTPHIAGYSLDGKANGTKMIINQMAHFFNLPLTDWSPDNIPDPICPFIDADRQDNSDQDIITDSILSTYPIGDDSSLLKQSPDKFEELRGNYRNRREFNSYTITGDHNAIKTLKKLGFNSKDAMHCVSTTI
ncbi:MAG: 4-phosphoerythronate dehydrogenase [Bacteroidales bacterium]|nr:4-phosphoerythronate dehydrogenase [Bacteroidales bacterium]